jgi:hypothetical protein
VHRVAYFFSKKIECSRGRPGALPLPPPHALKNGIFYATTDSAKIPIFSGFSAHFYTLCFYAFLCSILHFYAALCRQKMARFFVLQPIIFSF